MSGVHPKEVELTCLSDGEAGVETARTANIRRTANVREHLRWCARCRSVVADYGWLQGEIAATLAAAADAVLVPRPKWWAVQEVLLASQRRQIAGCRVSAVASVVLAVCLMLSLSPVLGTAVAARTLPPAAMVAPAPATAAASGERMAAVATPTPAMSLEGGEAESSPTPAFIPPPTPPEPGA